LLAGGGWIDFTRGAAFDYVPLQDVVRWQRAGSREQLLAHFRGQVVLVGSVLPYLDRLRLPAPLTRWEEAVVPPPGLIANAQVLRNALGGGLVRPLPRLLAWLALAGLAAAALPAHAALRYLLLAAGIGMALAGGTLLHAAGWFFAPGAAIVAGIGAVALRTGLDLAGARRDRERLARNFGGYLSPALLRSMFEETRDDAAERQGVRRPIALLFADLQDFTQRTEHSDPEHIRVVLNRYYAAITPGLHARGGVIDNFRGDGIMVMFGALQKIDRPCDAALAAAAELLRQIDRLNREELVPHGIAAVRVTMGLAYGDVVYGEVGSPDRRDFTALGDAVNVAAHLQGIAKQVGYPLVMTAVFAENLADPVAGLVDLGMPALKGHSPLRLYAWSPRAGPGHCAGSPAPA
jgi:adenylate cyclase